MKLMKNLAEYFVAAAVLVSCNNDVPEIKYSNFCKHLETIQEKDLKIQEGQNFNGDLIDSVALYMSEYGMKPSKLKEEHNLLFDDTRSFSEERLYIGEISNDGVNISYYVDRMFETCPGMTLKDGFQNSYVAAVTEHGMFNDKEEWVGLEEELVDSTRDRFEKEYAGKLK